MKKTISLITGVFVLLVAVGFAFASAEAEGGHHGATKPIITPQIN